MTKKEIVDIGFTIFINIVMFVTLQTILTVAGFFIPGISKKLAVILAGVCNLTLIGGSGYYCNRQPPPPFQDNKNIQEQNGKELK